MAEELSRAHLELTEPNEYKTMIAGLRAMVLDDWECNVGAAAQAAVKVRKLHMLRRDVERRLRELTSALVVQLLGDHGESELPLDEFQPLLQGLRRRLDGGDADGSPHKRFTIASFADTDEYLKPLDTLIAPFLGPLRARLEEVARRLAEAPDAPMEEVAE